MGIVGSDSTIDLSPQNPRKHYITPPAHITLLNLRQSFTKLPRLAWNEPSSCLSLWGSWDDMVEPPQLAASSNSRGHPGPAPWTHRASPQPSSEVRGAARSLLQPRVGTTDRLMTEKVLRRQIISTVSSSVGYFNILCLCKRHNGTRHKLTPSRSSGTSWRDAGELSGFEQLSCLQAPAPSGEWGSARAQPWREISGCQRKPRAITSGAS